VPALKRSDCLVFFFKGGNLRCKNYLTAVEVETTPLLVSVLEKMDRWRSPQAVEQLLSDYSSASVRRTLRRLTAHTLVVEKGSAQARQEAALAPWAFWGTDASFFHFATKEDVYRTVTNELRLSRKLLKEAPQPPLVKRYSGARHVALPRPGTGLNSEFPRVLLARRTHRRFGPGSISLEQLSLLLRLTWGVTGFLPWPGLGRLLLKTSPSGGARHSLEVYVWLLKADGLPRGLYHYRGDRHQLELLGEGATGARMAELCARQRWVRDCSALFVMTAVFPRVMWRYRFSRAYRTVLLEAGHFCQTFCLVATWLGLAPFCTAALSDQKIESDLGVDGASESVLYAAGVGPKAPRLPSSKSNISKAES
jgi:SagB-type dehydrogenase family enzyme